MKHFCRMVAYLGLLVVMLVSLVPAADLPETAFDESDTPTQAVISQTPIRIQLAPTSRSAQVPVQKWTHPSSRLERVQVADSSQRPGTRVALALFCTLLC